MEACLFRRSLGVNGLELLLNGRIITNLSKLCVSREKVDAPIRATYKATGLGLCARTSCRPALRGLAEMLGAALSTR